VSVEKDLAPIPLTAVFRQLDSSSIVGDVELDLESGLARLTAWMNEPKPESATTLEGAISRNAKRRSTQPRGKTIHSESTALTQAANSAAERNLVQNEGRESQHTWHPTPAVAHEEHNADNVVWELVRAAQGGDRSAFALLYDKYVDVVFRYVLFRVKDRELAEDVTSETFLRALRTITSISYQGRDVGAWFVTIARHMVLDQAKSSWSRLVVTTPEISDSGQVEVGPEQQVMSKVTGKALHVYIAQLSDDERECIVLRFLQGLSVGETARVMNRNDGAIKALQHRAVVHLAQLLPADIR
jgi:RNA polymerase sigma-70 factor (ECF subfamily)